MFKKFALYLSISVLLLSCTSTNEMSPKTSVTTRMKRDGVYFSSPQTVEKDGKTVELSMYLHFTSDKEVFCAVLPTLSNETEQETMDYIKHNFTTKGVEEYSNICFSEYFIDGNTITITPISKPEDSPYSLIIATDEATGEDSGLLVLLSPDQKSTTSMFFTYTPFKQEE